MVAVECNAVQCSDVQWIQLESLQEYTSEYEKGTQLGGYRKYVIVVSGGAYGCVCERIVWNTYDNPNILYTTAHIAIILDLTLMQTI